MKNFKLLTLMLAVSLVSVSCLVDDEDKTLDALANTPYVVGFNQNVANESYFEDIGAVEKTYPVNLIGGQDGNPANFDIVVNYRISPESTATEGQEFDFVENTGQLVIPAGQDYGLFGLLINTGGLDPNTPTQLILELESVEGGRANVGTINELNLLKITFVGCNSQLAGNYELTTTRADGAQTVRPETITLLGPNYFETESTGLWGTNAIGVAPDSSMNFEDICGEVFVPLQGLAQGFYSNEVYGVNLTGPDGEVDQTTLDFYMDYWITFSAGNSQYNASFERL
ncbi:hypothetical protein [Hanstruepera ponticola]|uniref:hypothetical protein n=1 Tax=Hanstruepera ponticola TaxID=2042995 RepID=UPI00177B3E9D|nr:hypothetical protein [Hanstruepera ponticola]